MKTAFIFCSLFLISCGLPYTAIAQYKRYVVPSDFFPDRSGSLVAFKVTYNGVPDTVYFLDVPSATITERVAEGSFGLEFKMMKAGVLKSDLSMRQGARVYERYPAVAKKKHIFYQVTKGDTTVASAWLPETSYAYEQPEAVFRSNPRRVLLYRRLDGRRSLYNMLDTSADGVAKLLYVDKANKEAEHEHNAIWQAHISPDGRYVLAATEGVMIDLEKGRAIWDYDWENSGWFYATFSENGSRVAIERKDFAVSIRDMQRGKELFRIPAPPAKLGNLTARHCIPLADMQHALVYYEYLDGGQIKLFLCGVDGSRREIAF